MSIHDFLNPLANVTPRFTEEQLEEMIQWFDSHAKPLLIIEDAPVPTKLKVVTIEQLISFLELKKFHRRHFNYPTYSEIMTEVEKLHAEVTRMLTREQFIYILNLWVLEAELKHELELAFAVFDTENRQSIEVEKIQEIVTAYGDDPFSEAEVLEIMRDANTHGDGHVVYAEFVETIFNLAPELYDMNKAEFLFENADEDPSVPPEPVIEEEPPPPPPPPPPPKKEKGGKNKKKK